MSVTPFIAHPPGDQNADTYRQFVELQRYIGRLEERIAPLYGGAPIVAPIVLTDAYQTVELQPSERGLPTLEAIYFCLLRLSASGTTANAFLQIRLTGGLDLGTVIEGSIVDIGNNSLEIATLAATFPIFAGGIIIELRGQDCTVLSGAFDVHRVGAGP